jgi:hypothetical protein
MIENNSEFPHIYLVPGLGADGRIFNKLVWREGIKPTALHWIDPLPEEKTDDYALRMLEQVDTGNPFVLVGVSLGGIISIEMAKHVMPEKIILISSIKNKKERPFYFTLGRYFKSGVWLPIKHRKLLQLMIGMFFGSISKEQFDSFVEMTNQFSDNYIKWAELAIINWDNTTAFSNLTHIHGTSDLIFPKFFIKDHIPVKGGTHFMIVNRAREIGRILDGLLFQQQTDRL